MINKRGSEIVEAAIVLPVFILIVAALIGICIFHFESFLSECNVQKEVVDSIREENAIFKRIEKNASLSRGDYSRSYAPYGYALDEASIIRAGDMLLE